MLEPFISLEKLGENPVTTLLEICQKNGCKPRYDTESWDKDQTAKVYVKDCLVGKATFGKKDIAINRAAKDALDNIDQTYLVFSMHEKDQKSSDEVLSEEENNEDS